MSVKGFRLQITVNPSALMRELTTQEDVDAEVARVRTALNELYPDRLSDDAVDVEFLIGDLG